MLHEMTALIVWGSIACVLTILLSASLTVYVKITDEVSVKIGALGYKMKLDLSGKEEKPEKKKKPSGKKKPEKVTKPSKKPSEQSFFELVDFGIKLFKPLLHDAVKLLSHLRIIKLVLCMTVTAGSADKTAIHYGAISGGIYTFLGVLDNAFTLKMKRVSIAPDFLNEKAVYNISFKLKLRFIFILLSAFHMLFSALGALIQSKSKKQDAGNGLDRSAKTNQNM